MKYLTVLCEHWSAGACAVGKAGGRPSARRCERCKPGSVTGTVIDVVESRGRTPARFDFAQMWAELHRRPFSAEWTATPDEMEWFYRWSRSLPCGSCARHWREVCEAIPPVVAPRDAYFAWTVAAHNAVNALLKKPEVSLDAARQKWTP